MIDGPIKFRRAYLPSLLNVPTPIPVPQNTNPRLEAFEIVIDSVTGRCWVIGNPISPQTGLQARMVTPYSREEITQGSGNFTYSTIADRASFVDGGKLRVEGTGKFAFETAPYLESIPNAMSLATDANGRIIAGTGGTALYVQVSNHTGSPIAKGSAVYISGAAGQIPRITKAQSNSYLTTDAFGLTAETIAHGGTGNVIISGLLTDVDTSTFGDGDVLYVSATTAGLLTNTEPAKPNWQMQIGTVAYAHQNHGKIVVHPNLESVKTEYIVDMTAAGETLATLAPMAEGTVLARLTGAGAGSPSAVSLGYGFGGLSNITVALTHTSTALASPVATTLANTWYDGPSVTLSAGTWLLDSTVSVQKGAVSGTTAISARLSTGTVHYCSSTQSWNTTASAVTSFGLSSIVTLASTETIKIQVNSSIVGGAILAFTPHQSSGNNATNINAVRIA